jgi:hypothetical protein
MNFFDVLLILIFISLVIALIYKSIIIENYENKEDSSNNKLDNNKSSDIELDSNKSNNNESSDIELNSNEISCCKMKKQENINYIENNISKIKDMFQFFDEYQKDIKENINYINLNKNKLNQSIELTKEMNEKYNEEQDNINKN